MSKKHFADTTDAETHAAAFGSALARGKAATKKKRPKGPRWPEQRDAFRRAGTTAGCLKNWIGCTYLRARDLRSGHAMLRGEELAAIMHHAPITATLVADTMRPLDVRQRGLFDDKEGAK